MDIELGVTGDFHVHLRDGEMMELVTPTIKEGGVSVVYVMPNLVPPIVTLKQVTEYKAKLEKLAPETTFLMSFYLSRDLTPELVEEAAISGAIQGIKCYPAGVTTNSQHGIDPNDFSDFYDIFKVMQKHDLILNLHGEKPSTKHDHGNDTAASEEHIHVLNAESKFMPALEKLHRDFPQLKIVLEHCTTKDAIDMVEKINAGVTDLSQVKVAATITAHHLYITLDDVVGNPINFCKPVAKLPVDRQALVQAATSGKPYFFFGSDSAPHVIGNKVRNQNVCAGVYTQNNAISYLAEVFYRSGKLHNLKKFVSDNGMSFYNMVGKAKSSKTVKLVKEDIVVPEFISNGSVKVQPFMPKETLQWKVQWSD